MARHKFILWEVDVQADFMLPGGKLYVPGSEKIIPNIKRLTDAAREGHTFLVSSADAHSESDPEFKIFPSHCVKGTAGARLIPEGLAGKCLTVPNEESFTWPESLSGYRQLLLEKQTLDVFDNPKAGELVERLGDLHGHDAEYVLFGVVTEFCVERAARGHLKRGHNVTVVTDAIEALNPDEGRRTLNELRALGARMLTTDEALAEIRASAGPATGDDKPHPVPVSS